MTPPPLFQHDHCCGHNVAEHERAGAKDLTWKQAPVLLGSVVQLYQSVGCHDDAEGELGPEEGA